MSLGELMMGIFEDEERRMLQEEADERAREAQERADRVQVARTIETDLKDYTTRHPFKITCEITRVDNVVTIRQVTATNSFGVTCLGPDAYELSIDGTLSGAGNTSTMARSVIHWLRSIH